MTVAASVHVAVGAALTVEGLAAVQPSVTTSTIRFLKVVGRGADAKGRGAPGWVIPNGYGTNFDGAAHSR